MFKLHETKKTVDRVRAEVEAARNAELQFEGIKARPVSGAWKSFSSCDSAPPAQCQQNPCGACQSSFFVHLISAMCRPMVWHLQMPSYAQTGADVKLTVATVLREDALFRKKQREEAALIKVCSPSHAVALLHASAVLGVLLCPCPGSCFAHAVSTHCAPCCW